MPHTTILIDEAHRPSSTPASGAQISSNERQAASKELAALDEASMCWVAGGPNGSIGVIGR